MERISDPFGKDIDSCQIFHPINSQSLARRWVDNPALGAFTRDQVAQDFGYSLRDLRCVFTCYRQAVEGALRATQVALQQLTWAGVLIQFKIPEEDNDSYRLKYTLDIKNGQHALKKIAQGVDWKEFDNPPQVKSIIK